MKIKKSVLLTLPVLIAVGLFIYMSKPASSSQQERGEMPPTPVTVYTVQEKEVVFTKDLPGRTSAFQTAEIRPQVSGIVIERLFTEGSHVNAGQQLYQIDPAPYQAAYESALANLKKAEANLSSAEPKAARYAELVLAGGVSRQENDDAAAALAQAKADIAVAAAAVKTAKINLDYTKVFAPISGRIGKSSVTKGALVTANQASALATIQNLSRIYVDVNQSGIEMMNLRRQISEGAVQKKDAELILEGESNAYGHKGEIQFSDVTVDEGTGMVQLRILFPNPEGYLLPGLFVKARVEQDRKQSAITVPQQAVVRNADGSITVWAVDETNTVNPKPISVSDVLGDRWLVTDGLKAGDRVVVAGLQKIQPMAKVNPSEMTTEK